MIFKLPTVLITALAITAQVAHGKHTHPKRHYGYAHGASNTSVTSITPLSSTISTPAGTGSSGSPLSSSPVPLSTGPSTTPEASKSVPLGTGHSAPPFPTSSKPGSPSNTVPLGTGVKGVPGQVTVVTSDSTLTYTIGTGSDTTVITTHIKHTLTSTLTQVSFHKRNQEVEHLLTRAFVDCLSNRSSN